MTSLTEQDFLEFFSNQRGQSQFTMDGALRLHQWEKSQDRILFYLKENYGYQDHGIMKIEEFAPKWLQDRNRTYVNCCTLAAGYLQARQTGIVPTEEEIQAISQNHQLLENAFDSMAVVNIKKSSGESVSNDAEIREESYANAAFLKRQIESLQPTVVIACGLVCWHSLVYDLGLNKNAHDLPRFSTARAGGILLCHSCHPAARGGEWDVQKLLVTLHSAA